MALLKTLRRRGSTASYIYLDSLRWSRSQRTCSAIFGLCADAEHRAQVKRGETKPIEEHVATVRLEDDMFDRYFPSGVKAAGNISARVFKAIKAGDAQVKIDEGAEFLRDAESDE